MAVHTLPWVAPRRRVRCGVVFFVALGIVVLVGLFIVPKLGAGRGTVSRPDQAETASSDSESAAADESSGAENP